MKNMKKILLTVVAAMLLVVMSVGGTLAYLQSQTEDVKNTFTVGKIDITLDEAKVNEEGEPVDVNGKTEAEIGEGWTPATRVIENEYKLMPGHEYTKDPVVHVAADSEESYVRIFVTINKIEALNAIFNGDFMPEDFVGGTWDSSVWPCVAITSNGDTNTYEFRYHTTVGTEDGDAFDMPALFQKIVMPEGVTNAQIDTLAGLNIDIYAQAIQKDGFNSADDAWAKWSTSQAK